MFRSLRTVLFYGALVACPLAGLAQDTTVSRGRYLVNEMAKCGDCHTPRLPTGAPDMSRFLKGTALSFQPIHPVPGWAAASTDLTATSPLWKSWGEKGMIQFFLSGHTPDGKMAAPPMPVYTLTRGDATAIVNYLKSLK
jgi:mono/diheme cytochrome c family protein